MTRKSPDRDTTIEDIHPARLRIAEKFDPLPGHHLDPLRSPGGMATDENGYSSPRPALAWRAALKHARGVCTESPAAAGLGETPR